MLGSPPRVRSRHGLPVSGACPPRITSACAEQTYPRPAPQIIRRDHLRVCGADIVAMPANGLLMGSPPRVRSRHRHGGRYAGGRGITSACAEQTTARAWACSPGRDHLRVCGADILLHPYEPHTVGSPPRVRSRLENRIEVTHASGITSACAEQTGRRDRFGYPSGDHLRVCGADVGIGLMDARGLGSPPRVRSRRVARPPYRTEMGITSACAEQTATFLCSTCRCRDHLRVCGADTSLSRMSPGRGGITSACAEQTWCWRGRRRLWWDHLRVCGADAFIRYTCTSQSGSSPRVRSRRCRRLLQRRERGITSACAEQTYEGLLTRKVTWDHLRVCGADTARPEGDGYYRGSPPRVRSRRTRR